MRFTIVLMILAAIAPSAFARADNAGVRAFNIPAGDMSAALSTFADQSELQLFFEPGLVKGLTAPAVKGELDAREALTQLLKDSGLRPTFVSATTVVLKRQQIASSNMRQVEGDDSQVGIELAPVKADTAQKETSEIVVTGSHIRNANPVASNLTSFSREDIDKTGFAAVQDFLDTLPQNFGSAPSEELAGVGNFNRGTGVNLRGLGAGATLVLVNGRRQPASGLESAFVDISSLPIGAIERVEVLTDGASAVYGSDAIGGVVNFVLRKDYDGAETQVRYGLTDGGGEEQVFSQLFGKAWSSGHVLLDYQYYDRERLSTDARDYGANADKRPFGGSDFRSTLSNPGNFLGGPPYAIPAGQNGSALTVAQLLPGVTNRDNQLLGTDILPNRKLHAVFASVDQHLNDDWSVFLEGRFSRREMESRSAPLTSVLSVTPANPFYVNPNPLPFALIGYSFYDDFGPSIAQGVSKTFSVSAGTALTFGRDWQGQFTASTGEERLDFSSPQLNQTALTLALADGSRITAFNPFGDGSNTNPATLAGLLTPQIEKGRTQLDEFNLTFDGSLFSTAAGSAKLALGLDHRIEKLERGAATLLKLDRDVSAAFFEIVVPLTRQLKVIGAGRYEDYSDFGDTFNPKLGINYSPLESVELHGSWGTSFKAPAIFDLEDKTRPTNFVFQQSIPDPTTGGFANAIIRGGGNANLKEETADTWTAGLTFKLPAQLRANVSYYDIRYHDRIITPGPANQTIILSQENIWSSIINRTTSTALIAAECNDPVFTTNRAACLASTSAVLIDIRKVNIARTEVSGIDFSLDQSFQTGAGIFNAAVNATFMLDYKIAVSPSSPIVELVDTVNNPVSLRLRAVGSWNRDGLSASLAFNHVGSYEDRTTTSVRGVDAWNTVDIYLGYEFSAARTWLRGTRMALSVVNALDNDPPFVNRAIGYDAVSASPIGRFTALQLTKAWGGH